MAVEFETKITGIATSTINGLEGVIKRVDFVLRGTKENHIYELPESVSLVDPTPEIFKTLSTVQEADVIEWVRANYGNWESIKTHVEYMLDKQIAQGQLTPTVFPWVTN